MSDADIWADPYLTPSLQLSQPISSPTVNPKDIMLTFGWALMSIAIAQILLIYTKLRDNTNCNINNITQEILIIGGIVIVALLGSSIVILTHHTGVAGGTRSPDSVSALLKLSALFLLSFAFGVILSYRTQLNNTKDPLFWGGAIGAIGVAILVFVVLVNRPSLSLGWMAVLALIPLGAACGVIAYFNFDSGMANHFNSTLTSEQKTLLRASAGMLGGVLLLFAVILWMKHKPS